MSNDHNEYTFGTLDKLALKQEELALTAGQYRDPVPKIQQHGNSRTPNLSEEQTEVPFPERPEWMGFGNCVGTAVRLFFPIRGEDSKDAKEVCRGCFVREECLAFGMDQRYGIWGGLSERERRRLRKAS